MRTTECAFVTDVWRNLQVTGDRLRAVQKVEGHMCRRGRATRFGMALTTWTCVGISRKASHSPCPTLPSHRSMRQANTWSHRITVPRGLLSPLPLYLRQRSVG